MISRLLVANRGEIARRVFRTCRDMGIGTVAVCSDADAAARHAADADLAVRLPGNAPGETYLRSDLLIRAALDAGADAVHPGYGFLSENAAFARDVLDAGLTWVGPPPEAIEAMGSKIASKKLMADAGVPVLSELDPAAVTEADLPVLVKASAGGGGRGMRIVRSVADLPAAVEAAQSEAASAFGDPTVFCEPYVEAGRHIEVQVLADRHGTVWALGERECSIQRRHQKVVEEAPSPMVEAALRQQLCDAAVAAARAIGYVGAGTVEFLVAPGGRSGARARERDRGFWFLEMNTRLQVEHPVTECVTGLDLVRLQLHVAEGEPLHVAEGEPLHGAEGERLVGEPPAFNGHAIEVRLYAEDPTEEWRPQSGTLHRLAVPGVDAEFAVPTSYGLRLDSGFGDGDQVSVHYDPMLAKVIAWAPTRDEAARRLAAALERAHIHGVTTNRDLLVRVLRHPAFLAGDTHTHFFDLHGLAALAAPLADKRAEALSALAAGLADAAVRGEGATVWRGLPSGWRNLTSQPQRKSYEGPTGQIDIAYLLNRCGLAAEGFEDVALVSMHPDVVVFEIAGVRQRFAVAAYDRLVCVESPLGSVSLVPMERFPDPQSQMAAGSLLAPMPGAVTAVHVSEGEAVRGGQPLLVLEAMKMQHSIVAPDHGVVRSLHVKPGDQVESGAVLAVVTADES